MTKPAFYTTPVYRLLSAAFGVALLGCGGWVLMADPQPTPASVLGMLVIATLGGNHVWTAIKGREPWASKLGI
jgi:hypothetical protein